MENSILISIKKNLGLHAEDTSFDADLIMHINSVFGILWQMGVGPSEPFSIQGDTEVWSSFLKDKTRINYVKSYVEKKVKLLFDPPLNGAVTESLNNMIRELEWRLYSEENFPSPASVEALDSISVVDTTLIIPK